MDIFQILYLYLLAFTLALLEVQIEGEHGWAAKLPCWRPAEHKWYSRIYTRVMGGKEMTGYHVVVFSFALLILHLPYAWGLTWSTSAEFQTLSQFFLFVVVWDFLWFVLNPHFDLRQFRPGCVAWHKIWVAGLPVDYWGGLALSFLFHALRVDAGVGVRYGMWFWVVGGFALLVGVTIVFAALVKRFREKS